MKNFQDKANKQAWTLPTQLGMLLTFIEKKELLKELDAYTNQQIKEETEMTEGENELLDRKGYALAVGQSVNYSVLEVVSGESKAKTITRTGEITEIKFDTCMILDDKGEEFEIAISDIEVIMDMECGECGHEFNHNDVKTIMVNGVGHNYDEQVSCPKCESGNISQK